MNTSNSPFKTHLVAYSPEPTRRRSYASSKFMVVGLFLCLFVVMFRPGGAEAVLPANALVFDKYDASSGATVKYSDVPPITADYDIVLNGKKTPTKISLTGIPLAEMLKAGGANVDNITFATVRRGTPDNRSIALIPLDQGSPRPAMVLDKGTRPGAGPFGTPMLVPGQPTTAPISEKQMVQFDRRDEILTIIPSKPGAKLMSVRITSKKTRAGQYKLSAKVSSGGSGGSLKYQWYAGDNLDAVSNTSTYTTTDATSGTSRRNVNLVVTETSTGSMGARSYGYTSRKSNDDGQTTDPTPKTDTNGGSTAPTGGTTPGNGGNGVLPTPLTTPQPPQTTAPPATPTPQTTPPPKTPPVQSDQDTTAITNLAQNIDSTSGLQTVSGVLLSSPSIAPAGGGGVPINELPAPVATELNTIFQPVEDPGDIWPYLLAILFATTLAGAIRESISP